MRRYGNRIWALLCVVLFAAPVFAGVDVSQLESITLEPVFHLLDGKILVRLDYRTLRPVPTAVNLQLRGEDKKASFVEKVVTSLPKSGKAEATLDVSDLTIPPQQCEIRAVVVDAGGKPSGRTSSHAFDWPLTKKWVNSLPGVRVLNNFVFELLNVKGVQAVRSTRLTFFNPREGWVFVRSSRTVDAAGRTWICLDSDEKESAIIIHAPEKSGTCEAMRFLSKGEHTLTVLADRTLNMERLVVRAIPEWQYAKYKRQPNIRAYGTYDWTYLKKHVHPHINTIIMRNRDYDEELAKEWKAQGKRWIVEWGVPGAKPNPVPTPEEVYTYWTQSPGFQNPLIDGMIADEIGSYWPKRHEAWTEGVRKIAADAKFRGKRFYVYGGGDALRWRGSTKFTETLMASGYKFTLGGTYVKEKPSQEEYRQFLTGALRKNVLSWQQRYPNAMRSALIHLGYFSAPPESLNINPSVDYKVAMDMTLHFMATDPAYFGAYGAHWYTSAFADEEYLRWAYRLFRHYCIEGNTPLLSNDPYEPRHITNPDFEHGTAGWEVVAAEEGSVRTGRIEKYSALQGRFKCKEGDTFLVMRRNAKAPNRVSQVVKTLQPGRCYSVKLITADYKDIRNAVSARKTHTVNLSVSRAQLLPEKCFREIFHSWPGGFHRVLGFTSGRKVAWMNYHFTVFRAKADTARLTISDWADTPDPGPGGPIGQEVMYNFVEVQPYYDD